MGEIICKIKLTSLLILLFAVFSNAAELISIQKFDVKPGNSPAVNKVNLQKAIDWATTSGSALYVKPAEDPYHIDGGIILKKNVSLIGVNGPTPRGTVHPTKNQSWDFLLVKGDKKLTISIFGSRMRNYVSDKPISIENNLAVIQAVACVDKNEDLYNAVFPQK